jgi:molybdate-binding protein
VTGRWLFPKTDIDRWLAASLVRPDALTPAEAPPIIGGSHDPLLEWALRESGSALASLPEGSVRGLERFTAGEVMAAAIHLHPLEGEADANVEAMRGSGRLHDAVLIGFARREQGLLVASGNPLKLASLSDVVTRGARLALRPKGAGAQLLLCALLHCMGVSRDRLVIGPTCPTGPDLAQAIRSGRADCGVATRSVAQAMGLDFIPLVWERFDLVLRQRDYFHPPLQALVNFLRTPAFAARAHEFGGYDVSETGRVRYVS